MRNKILNKADIPAVPWSLSKSHIENSNYANEYAFFDSESTQSFDWGKVLKDLYTVLQLDEISFELRCLDVKTA